MELPPDLKQLERELAERPRAEPPPDLRRRVLGGARVQLRRELRQGWWAFAASAAAAAVLIVNVSISAVQATDFDLYNGARSKQIAEAAQQIRQALPEISEEEARRQAVLLNAGANLPFYPGQLSRRSAAEK